MTLDELVRFLPMTMPTDLHLRVGDTVYVRLDRCKHRLHKGLIKAIQSEEDLDSVSPEPGSTVTIDVETEDVTYRVEPFLDSIYTPEWINQYAGDTVVKEEEALRPKPKMSRRFKRLLEQRSPD